MAVDTSKVLTFIMAGGKGQRLEPLTRDRPKPAVSFGGTYKIIDFTLSNCLNSNLRKIFVLVQYKSAELIRHIRDGWQMYFSHARNEYIEAIPPQYARGDQWYLGTADSIFQNFYFLEQEEIDFVLILAGDHIYKMDYRHMINFHIMMESDLTVGAVEVPTREGSNFGIIHVDESNKIIDFKEKPRSPPPLPANPNLSFASMGIYVFKPAVLREILLKDSKNQKSSHDFGRDIIPSMIDSYRVFAFSFIDENKKAAKYWRDIGTIEAYYNASMDLVAVDPFLNLYDNDWPVKTAFVHGPPPKFVFRENDRKGQALDSLVSSGCIISGASVENSILSPFVRVESYSNIEESIIFDSVTVGRYAKIRRAVIDHGVHIPANTQIGYNLEQDSKRFLTTESGIVVVSKDSKLVS